MNPRVDLSGFELREDGTGIVQLTDGTPDESRAWRLSLIASRLVVLADGTRDVDALAHAASTDLGQTVTTQAVWAALDGLADIGVIQRLAPPAGDATDELSVRRVNRRKVLGGVGVAAAALFATGLGGQMAAAASEEASKEERVKAGAQEDAAKETKRKEQDAKHAERDAEHAEEKAKQAAAEDRSKEERQKQR